MTSSRYLSKSILVAFTFLLVVFSIRAQVSVDTSFHAALTKVPEGDVQGIFPQPDGKVFVVGAFKVAKNLPRTSIVKLNADGTPDTSFVGPDFAISQTTPPRILDLEFQSTGKIIVGGEFIEADGIAKYRLVRLNPNGSLDTTFAPQPITYVVRDIVVLPDDKIVVGGSFQYLDSSGTRNRLVRLNSDGTLDTAFTFSPEPADGVTQIQRQADGKLIVAAGNKLIRYTTTGAQDATFGPINADNLIISVRQQADGRILVGGYFANVNGFALPRLFRTTIDGALDGTFASTSPNSSVLSIFVAPDQKILIGGEFLAYGGVNRKRAALLDPNGNLTATFNPTTNPMNTVYAVAMQADGKVLIGGQGDRFGNVPLLFRTNVDGSIDSSFAPELGFNGIGARIKVLPDGKILVSGQFLNANSANRLSIAKFNTDGSLDASFVPSPDVGVAAIMTGLDVQTNGNIIMVGANQPSLSGFAVRMDANGNPLTPPSTQPGPRDVRVLPDGLQFLIGANNWLARYNANGTTAAVFASIVGSVYRIVVLPDGKVLIGGSFTQVNGVNRNGIARLNSDGSTDTSFNPFGGANGIVQDIAVQADGKVIIGGEFTGVNFDTSRKYIARLNSDGSLDTSYTPVVNAPVYALKVQPDGRLLIGGDMTLVNGTPRSRFARLNANGTLEPTFTVSPNDTVLNIELQPDGKILYAGRFTKTNGLPTIGIGRLLNPAVPVRTPFDFDGDGRADISVFRSSTNRWYEVLSSTGGVVESSFGAAGDILAPADFDGDGKTDEAIFRPSTGQWWYQSSINDSQNASTFGASGDIPRPSDFDGDGKADFVLFRPSNNTWYRYGSSVGAVPNVVFGSPGDQPLVGDFDGDGKSDLAVFRPSSGDWWYAASSAGNEFRTVHWGQNGDIPVPADFDGDGRTDVAIFRPSDGGWYIYNSSNGSFTIMAFGTSGDRPVAADYDGDGRADVAVFRPSTGIWYLFRSTAGFAGYQFGISTDTAIPGSLIP